MFKIFFQKFHHIYRQLHTSLVTLSANTVGKLLMNICFIFIFWWNLMHFKSYFDTKTIQFSFYSSLSCSACNTKVEQKPSFNLLRSFFALYSYRSNFSFKIKMHWNYWLFRWNMASLLHWEWKRNEQFFFRCCSREPFWWTLFCAV